MILQLIQVWWISNLWYPENAVGAVMETQPSLNAHPNYFLLFLIQNNNVSSVLLWSQMGNNICIQRDNDIDTRVNISMHKIWLLLNQRNIMKLRSHLCICLYGWFYDSRRRVCGACVKYMTYISNQEKLCRIETMII